MESTSDKAYLSISKYIEQIHTVRIHASIYILANIDNTVTLGVTGIVVYDYDLAAGMKMISYVSTSVIITLNIPLNASTAVISTEIIIVPIPCAVHHSEYTMDWLITRPKLRDGARRNIRPKYWCNEEAMTIQILRPQRAKCVSGTA
jgi:hypothetical protein